MQHEGIGVSTKLGNNERYSLRHQTGDKGDVARQAVQLGNNYANRNETYYVVEVIRAKFPFDKLKDKIIEVKERYGHTASLVIEEGGISYGLIQSLREKDINVVDYKPRGDKRERLISQIDLFEGGSVLLPKDAPWLEEFVSELLSFPGRHDDQVDALAQGLAWRRETWKAPLVQRTTVGMS
jgi:predicted phage terminase large subunit-like protein